MTIKRVIFISDNLYSPVTANDNNPIFEHYTKFIDNVIFNDFKSIHLDLYSEYQRKFDTYLFSISSPYDLHKIVEIGNQINSIILNSAHNGACSAELFKDIYDSNGDLLSNLRDSELESLNNTLNGFNLTELLIQSLNAVFFSVGELIKLLDKDEFDATDTQSFLNINNTKLHDFRSKCISEFMVQLEYTSNQYDTGSADNQTEYLMKSGYIEFLYTRIINDLFEILFKISDNGIISNQYIKSTFFAAILTLRNRYTLYSEYMSLINHLVDNNSMGNFGNLGSYSISSTYHNFNKLLGITSNTSNSTDSNLHYFNTRSDKNSWDYKYDQYFKTNSNYDTIIIHNGYMTHKMLKYANLNSAIDYYIIKLENIRDIRYNNEIAISRYNPGDLSVNEFSRYSALPDNAHIDPKYITKESNILSFTDRYLAYYPFDIVIPYKVIDRIYMPVLNNYTFDSMLESSTNYSDTINTITTGTKSIYSGCYLKDDNFVNLMSHKYRYNAILFNNFSNFDNYEIPLSKQNNIKDIKFMLQGVSEIDIINKCELPEFNNNYIFVDPVELNLNAFVPSTYSTLKETVLNSNNYFGIVLDGDGELYSAEYLKPNPVFRTDLKYAAHIYKNTHYLITFNLSNASDYSRIFRNILIWESMIHSNDLNFVITIDNDAMFYNAKLFIKNIALRISESISLFIQLPNTINLNNLVPINHDYDGYDVIRNQSTINLHSCMDTPPAPDLFSTIDFNNQITKVTLDGFIYGRVALYGFDFEGDVNNTTATPQQEIEGIFNQFPYSVPIDSTEYADENHHIIKTYYSGETHAALTGPSDPISVPDLATDPFYTVLSINIKLIDFSVVPSDRDYTLEEEWYINAIESNNYQRVTDGGQILQPLSNSVGHEIKSYDGLRIGAAGNKITHFQGDTVLQPWYDVGGDNYLTADLDISPYFDSSTNSYLDTLYPNYFMAAIEKLNKKLNNTNQNYVVNETLWGDAIWPYYTTYV